MSRPLSGSMSGASAAPHGSAGGGPTPSWMTGGLRQPAAAQPAIPDFSNVGKFNVSVVSPGAFLDSQQENAQNASLVHGISQAFFGEHVGSPFGRTPLGLPARAAANVFDAVAAPFGDLLGSIGSIPHPLGMVLNSIRYANEADTPEKQAAQAEINKQGPLGFLEAARIEAKYLADLDVRTADPNETGLFAFNPALREANPFNATTVGGLVAGLGNALFTVPLLTERAIAGTGGTEGSQVEQILRKDPATLNPMQQKMVENVNAGKWSKEKAADYLVANNAGYTQDAGVNMALTFLLDVTAWGTFGAGLLAKAGRLGLEAPKLLAIEQKALEAARAVGDVTAETKAQQAITDLTTKIPGSQVHGLFPNVSGRIARTFIGKAAMDVMASPTLGPIARYAHNVIDPTRLIFKPGNPADQIVKSHLSLEMTMAVTKSYSEKKVYRVFNLLDKLQPGLSQKVQQSMGEYTAGLVRTWAAKQENAELLKRNFNEFTLPKPSEAIAARIENLPADIGVSMEQHARDVTPLTTNAGEITQRMAAAYGGKAEDYGELVAAIEKSTGNDGLAYLHAATTAAARTDLLGAVAAQAGKGTWKLKQDIQKLILIGPGELTTKRAKALLAELNKLKGPEKLNRAKEAVAQYDILRESYTVTDQLSVSDVMEHIKSLLAEGALASELTAQHITTLTGEVGDWLNKYGHTVDGNPLYGLGFRPRDEKLWRLVFDKQTGVPRAMNAWVDYVSEAAPGYRPGAFQVTPFPGMDLAPEVAQKALQKVGDWYVLGRDMLMHQVSTARVELEAKRRLTQGLMAAKMTQSEASEVIGALEKTRVGGAYEVSMRALSGERIWETASQVIPRRLLKGENAITKRQMMNIIMDAYKNELHIVGGTQLFTGQLKKTLDHLPGMQMLAGGNVVGQVAEGLWPNLKFRLNPFFQAQESVEGQFFGVAKGIRPYFRGKVTGADEQAFRVWANWDKGLERVGDQIENSISVIQGNIGPTLESATGLKRIKYVNAARQFRKSIGEEFRKFMPAEEMDNLKAHYGTYDDGEMAVRYLDDSMTTNRDILNSLDRSNPNAYEDFIAGAAWNKPVNQGGLAPLHLDLLARRMDPPYKDQTALVKAVRGRDDAITKTDVATRMTELGAHPEYVNRVMLALDWQGTERWWREVGKAFHMSPTEVDYNRMVMRAQASLHGMTEGEYLSQKFANKVGRFNKVEDIKSTDDILMMALQQEARDHGMTVYRLDAPETQQMLTRAREMRGETDMPAKAKANQQRIHDEVAADRTPYEPSSQTGVRVHTHTVGDKQFVTYTGNLGWGEAKAIAERFMTKDGMLTSANWYNVLPGIMLGVARGDTEVAAKMLLGFLYSQKATSPVIGMRYVMKALDRYQFIKNDADLARFFTDDLALSKDVIRKVMLGEPITSGLGVKLFDFTDAGLLQPKRFIGDLSPAPSDRWMIRMRGHMTGPGLGDFLKTYGYRNAEAAGFLDPRPFRVATGKVLDDGTPEIRLDSAAYNAAAEARGLDKVLVSYSKHHYEETTRWTNEMAAEANKEKWLGKEDWTGTEMQATLWNAVQHSWDAYPEAGLDMLYHNTTQMALEVRPSVRGPFHTLQADWERMTQEEQTALTDEVASQVSAVMTQRLGIPVVARHTGVVGSWEGAVAPNFSIEIVGTGETVDRAVLTGLAMNGQDHGIAVREMGTAAATAKHDEGFYHAFDFVLPTARRESNDTAQGIARLPTMLDSGFMPFTGRDGKMRLRSVWMTDENTTRTQAEARIAQLRTELDAAGYGDVGVELKGVHVVQHGQDWEADPRGRTIAERLSALGPAGEDASRQLYGHVDPSGSVTQPLIGEFRTIADDHIRDHLGGDATRGRAPIEDGRVEAMPGVEEGISPTHPDFYYWQSSHPTSRAITGHAAERMGIPGYSTADTPYESSIRSMQRQGGQLLEGVYNSGGSDVPLYSGQRLGEDGFQRVPKVGETISIPLKGTTPDRFIAQGFLEHRGERGFMYELPVGTKGVWADSHGIEVVTSGRFKVTGYREASYKEFHGRLSEAGEPNIPIFTLEQTEVFNPTLDRWEKLPQKPVVSSKEVNGDTHGFTPHPDMGSDGTEVLKMSHEGVVRGATTMTKDGRAILWASRETADGLTFAHELAHAMHSHLDPSMQELLIEQFNKETGRRTKVWSRATSEWFADSYIRALREGVSADHPEVQRAYNFFAKWMDKAINKGAQVYEKKGLAARGALAPQEQAHLLAPMRPENRALFDEMLKGPKADARPWNHTEEMTYRAMTDAAKQAGYDAFRVNFFKRNRSVLERTVNHPMFGLYPSSYMWGKVLPELVRFMAKDPFGFPGGHVAWAGNDIYHSMLQQSMADPNFEKFMATLGKNGAIRLLALMFPATPWEMPVNAPAWMRRIAQSGLEAEAKYQATGQDQKGVDFMNVWSDTMGYQFGGIPRLPLSIGQLLSGSEDLYSTVTGEPMTGKKAPSIGAGLQTLGLTVDQTFSPIGAGLPSLSDVFGGDTSLQTEDLTSQNDQLQTELDDAQSQLEGIFAQYPFTQQ